MAAFYKRISIAMVTLAAFCLLHQLSAQIDTFSWYTGVFTQEKLPIFTPDNDTKLQEINSFYWRARENFTDHNSSKWIVLMASEYTAEDIEQISNLKDWQVVIVTESDVSGIIQKQSVHYVNSEHGAIEGANILPPSRYLNRYARRNIGYLYAILNGAEWIYDIGHGIVPTNETLSLFDFGNYTYGLKYRTTQCKSINERIFNALKFFGSRQYCPASFSRELCKNHQLCKDCMMTCRIMRTPSVQHGLISQSVSNGEVEFSKFAPPIVLQGKRTAIILRSLFAQKLMHILGDTTAIQPFHNVPISSVEDTSEEDRIEKTFKIRPDFLKLLISWDCSDENIRGCMRKLVEMFKARHHFKVEDLRLFDHWAWSMRLHRYKYPTRRHEEEENGDQSGSPRHRNCRRAYVNLTSSTFWNSSYPDIKLAQKKLDYLRDLKEWCGEDLPSDGELDAKELATLHSADTALTAKKDTVLVIINNYPWSRSLGVLQRIHDPYFALTVFCGTLNREPLAEKGYPRTFKDFSYVDIDPTEILRGVFLYHCLSKVAEMRLRNVKGYFVTADDLVWNFWNEVDLDQAYHPLGILYRRLPSWYDGPVGVPALERTAYLMTETYRDYPVVQALLKRYGEGILKYRNNTDPMDYLTSINGYAASDFFYVPSTEIRFFYDLMQILYEGGVFKGIAVLKFLASVPHKVAERNRVINMGGKARKNWPLYYSEDVIMMHPVKQSAFLEQLEKSKFCYVIIKAFRNMLIKRYSR